MWSDRDLRSFGLRFEKTDAVQTEGKVRNNTR